MKNIGEEIKKAREAKGWTQEQMAEKMQISLRQFNKYESGILPKYKTSVAEQIDLLLGTKIKGKLYEQNIQEQNVLNEPVPYLDKRRSIKLHDKQFFVPLVPIAAQAGYAQHCYDMAYIEKLDMFPILPGIDPHGAEWRYFEIKGESMEPTLVAGQYVLTTQVIKDDWASIENGQVYVITTNEGVIVKRLYKVKSKDYWAAISDNADEKQFPQFRLFVKDVLELWKFRRKVDWEAKAPREVKIKV